MINENISKNTKLMPAICTQCGGQIEVNPLHEMAVCKYCGTSFFVKKGIQNYNVQQIENVESMNINNKRGAVESVLNFVERQQDKKQHKIDEEKRLEEEKKRRRQEIIRMLLGAIVGFLIDKKNWKRNYSILGALIFIIILFSFIGVTREKQSHSGESKTPSGSSAQEGRNYQDVIADFKNKGFTNIKIKVLDDLIIGWLTKDGEVESVSVDGDEDYSPDSWYPSNVEVIITYHTFPLDEEQTTESSIDEPAKENQESVIQVEEIVLTVENSEDLATLLKVDDSFDPFLINLRKNMLIEPLNLMETFQI